MCVGSFLSNMIVCSHSGALKKIESIRNVPSVTWSDVWYIALDLLVKIIQNGSF